MATHFFPSAYTLTAPLVIGPRLTPALIIALNTDIYGTISAEIVGFDEGPRARLSYMIDTSFGSAAYEAADLSVAPLYADDTPGDIVRRGIATICSFLVAEAEGYQATMGAEEPADGWYFDARVAEWAYLNADELSLAEMQLRGEAEED